MTAAKVVELLFITGGDPNNESLAKEIYDLLRDKELDKNVSLTLAIKEEKKSSSLDSIVITFGSTKYYPQKIFISVGEKLTPIFLNKTEENSGFPSVIDMIMISIDTLLSCPARPA